MTDLERLRELSLAEQIARMHRLWRTAADLELAPLGLTHPRWTALWKLSRMGNHVSQKTLAEALEIELASLMRTLGQLEEQVGRLATLAFGVRATAGSVLEAQRGQLVQHARVVGDDAQRFLQGGDGAGQVVRVLAPDAGQLT